MAAVALIPEIIWLALTLVRPFIAAKRSFGIWAVRATPGVGRLIGVFFVVTNVVLIVGPLGDMGGVVPRIDVFNRGIEGLGIAIGVFALALVWIAQNTMGDSWRIGVDPSERTGLITKGPYRMVRNPIYTGMVGLSISVAAMVPDVFSLITVALFVVAVQLQVRVVEEPYLRRVHGEEFELWSRSSGRFLPHVG